MWEWLFGKKKSAEMPEYSALTSCPNRGVPPQLAALEQGEKYIRHRASIEKDLCDGPGRPSPDAPLLTALVSGHGRGVVTLPFSSDGAHCLPVFSSPLRAADYRRTLLAGGPATQYLSLSPLEFVVMLRDYERLRIEDFVVDRCPRCTVVVVVGGAAMKTADDVISIWAIHKATELARSQLYLAFAVTAARKGLLEIARDIGLEAVGHVTMEDPQTHLLLGEVAIALGDRTLLQEAKTYLAFLKQDRWTRKLDQSELSGSPDFKGYE